MHNRRRPSARWAGTAGATVAPPCPAHHLAWFIRQCIYLPHSMSRHAPSAAYRHAPWGANCIPSFALPAGLRLQAKGDSERVLRRRGGAAAVCAWRECRAATRLYSVRSVGSPRPTGAGEVDSLCWNEGVFLQSVHRHPQAVCFQLNFVESIDVPSESMGSGRGRMDHEH